MIYLLGMWTNSYSLDVKVRVEAAAQLRDNLEHYITGPIYSPFLKKLIPIFKNILNGPPVFISTSAEQVRTPRRLKVQSLIVGIETAKLCSRNNSSPTNEPSRSL
jgi:hypothetical protein